MNDIEKIDERKKKSTKINLPCGINKNGEVVYVDDVKNGKACECFCPGCHQQLVAKNKGTDKTHHFAHKNKDNDCEHGYQSALHYMAKDLFTEMKELVFIKKGKIEKYKIDSVEIEHRLDSIIPDILVTCDGKQFIVEIFVTHAVDEEKKVKIKQMMISAIEINVSHLQKEKVDKEILRTELTNTENYSWIYDADDDLVEQKKKTILEYGTHRRIDSSMLIECPAIKKISNNVGINFLIPFAICENCIHYCKSDKKGFVACGYLFPIPLSIEERKKASENILCNKKLVLFSSEVPVYINQFEKTLLKSLVFHIPVKLRLR